MKDKDIRKEIEEEWHKLVEEQDSPQVANDLTKLFYELGYLRATKNRLNEEIEDKKKEKERAEETAETLEETAETLEEIQGKLGI